MKKLDLISIIVPVYNTGALLVRCIESILNNTYQNIEIIIIDDGSDKVTAEICDSCKYLSSKIHVHHTKNGGVSAARNYGIKKSKGLYITFVDADDTLDPEAIKTLHSISIENNADLAMIGYKECLPDGKFIYVNNTGETIIWNEQEITKEFLESNVIGWNVWAKLYKKDILNGLSFPLDKRVAEDMYFVYQVCNKSRKAVVHQVSLYSYIKKKNSAMADADCGKFFDIYDLVESIWNESARTEELRVAKNLFYVQNTIWFLRFIIAKDKSKQYVSKIANLKSEFLKNVDHITISKLSIPQKIEFYLISHTYPVFRIMSVVWRQLYRNQWD